MSSTVYGSNVHPNPSFEGALEGGILLGSAAITGAYGAYDGALALYMYAQNGGYVGGAKSSVYIIDCPVTTGSLYTWTFRYDTENAAAAQTMYIGVYYSDPTYSGYDEVIEISGGVTGWQLFTTTFTPSITPVRFEYYLPAPVAPVYGYMLIDDCTLRTTRTQFYPPDNGPRRKRQTWHVDDIMGTLVNRERAVRDEWRNVRDSWDTDEVGRDELDWRLPRERPVKEPR